MILKKRVPNSFFQFQLKVLTCLGLLLPKNRKLIVPFCLYAVPQVLINTICIVLFEIINIFMELDDDKSFNLSVGLVSLHAIIVSKMIAWFLTKNTILRIITKIERPTFNFEPFNVKNVVITRKMNESDIKYDDFKNCINIIELHGIDR